MAFNSVETIALILIILTVVKMFMLLVNPKSWINLAKKIYSNPKVVSLVSLILAGIVLYYLVQSGITIIQILAVTVFVALLLMIGLANEIDYFMKKAEVMIKKGTMWKEYWLYTLVWVLLILWGIKELFF